MTLHDRIARLYHGYDGAAFAFKDGYELAKNEATHIAKEADEMIMQMGNALASVDPDKLTIKQQDAFSSALIKYNAYKEQS